jgi:hypothetical protein
MGNLVAATEHLKIVSTAPAIIGILTENELEVNS